jgi:hypothetical protein
MTMSAALFGQLEDHSRGGGRIVSNSRAILQKFRCQDLDPTPANLLDVTFDRNGILFCVMPPQCG